jgi:hypothetical protein
MMIHSKFNGYKAGRRTYFGGGGGGDGGPAMGDTGIASEGPAAVAAVSDAADAAAGLSGFGGNDYFGQYGGQGLAGLPGASRPSILADYQAQQQPSVNTNIYRPTYTDYARSFTPAVSDYGTNMQSPFGQFVDPFAQSGSQGIASLYNGPAFDDYGLAGLNR